MGRGLNQPKNGGRSLGEDQPGTSPWFIEAPFT